MFWDTCCYVHGFLHRFVFCIVVWFSFASTCQVIVSENLCRRGATGGGALASCQGTFAPLIGEFWYFSSGMALAIGHMAMFHISRESDAFENPMLRNLCKESDCIALLSLSYCVHHSTTTGLMLCWTIHHESKRCHPNHGYNFLSSW